MPNFDSIIRFVKVILNKQFLKTSIQDINCLRNRAGMPNVVLTFASLISRVKVDGASHVLQRHPDQKVLECGELFPQ